MQVRRKNLFLTIRTEGSILPADLLQRIERGNRELKGLAPEDYHLPGNEKINETVSRSWTRLLGAWAAFKSTIEKASAGDPNTSATRERWLLPLFQEFGYGRLLAAKAVEIEGKPYPISHRWQHAPIHLVGSGVDLDSRTAGVAGAAKISPHSLVQEYLNRSEESLWGFASNGLRLRILRDNVSLTRQAFVEFDLQAMMNGEVYSDFVLLWLLCHESRVEAARPEECWLERWSRTAQEQGTRALEQLRKGVEEAIKVLGSGFLKLRKNQTLKDKLQSRQLLAQDYYRQLLRFVYRLLFLFVAEDRELLLDPKADEVAHTRYKRFYSAARLRKLAERRVGTRHSDLFVALRLVMQKLGSDAGCAELGLPALGSFLFSSKAMPDIEACELMNADLLAAIRALTFITDRHGRRLVDYKNLRSDELGGVYEALLELHPYFDTEAGSFELQTASGNERKTTGSYYTPKELVQCLLDSALDPVLDEAAKQPDPQAAILNLKICDPACGSGHFLIAAAHRIAKRLAAIRTGDEEPAPDALTSALRQVIGSCIYGVDINPMAIELCKFGLWMEALEPGKPLAFLEQHIQVGNSLLGTTPALLEKGIPDDAFKPIEGDNKAICAKFKKLNKEERLGFQRLFKETVEPWDRLDEMATEIAKIESLPADDIMGVRRKETDHDAYIHSSNQQLTKFLADAWCAAFVWKKTEAFAYPITEDVFRKIERNPDAAEQWMRDEIIRLAKQYQFFHWHLAFLNVFRKPEDKAEAKNQQAGWNGGFNVVLGNPPWERIKLQEKEWFAQRRPDIANAQNAAARGRMIEALADQDPATLDAFREGRRKAEGESHFVRSSNRYPLCGRGDINTYAIFAETNRTILGATGRVGCIVPSGIATDDTTKYFFQDLVNSQTLVSLHSFENEEFIFPEIHHATKFCLLTLSGSAKHIESADFVFFARKREDLLDNEKHFSLTPEEITLLNPNTQTCPIFRSKRDALLTKSIYLRIPILLKETQPEENPWKIKFTTLFHMANDSSLFRTREQLEQEGWIRIGNTFHRNGDDYLPLYEGKMFWHFDHRFGTYDGQTQAQANQGKLPELDEIQHANPNLLSLPRYWIKKATVQTVKSARNLGQYYIAFRDVTSAVVLRTCIFTVLPGVAVGHKAPLVIIGQDSPLAWGGFLGCVNSLVLDYVARQGVSGSSLSYFILKQLPILPPSEYSGVCPWEKYSLLQDWIMPRILELTYTARDLKAFAEDCGYDGEPFRWDDERRFLLRCELDAAYFHLYGIEREDVDYILETFPIVKRKDEQARGEYRTKRIILEIYDAMRRAIESGEPYQTRLNPPPADLSVAHPPQVRVEEIILPQGERVAFDNDVIYLTLVIFTLLHESGGSIDTQRLMDVCRLLAQPDKLEKNGAILAGSLAHEWRQRYCDKLDPELFLPVLDNLIRQAQIKLVPQGRGSKTVFVGHPEFRIDADVRFDVLFALKVSDALPETSLAEMPEVARSTELEKRYSSTG
jgi:N-6 DNA Methylase